MGIYFFFWSSSHFLSLASSWFVDHPALLKIGRDLAQCPMCSMFCCMTNRFKNTSESSRNRPLIRCARSIPFAYFV